MKITHLLWNLNATWWRRLIFIKPQRTAGTMWQPLVPLILTRDWGVFSRWPVTAWFTYSTLSDLSGIFPPFLMTDCWTDSWRCWKAIWALMWFKPAFRDEISTLWVLVIQKVPASLSVFSCDCQLTVHTLSLRSSKHFSCQCEHWEGCVRNRLRIDLTSNSSNEQFVDMNSSNSTNTHSSLRILCHVH